MNQITLNLIAIGIFSVVLMILVGPIIHLSPVVPALVGAGVLAVATIDTFGLQGQLGNLVVDGIAQRDPAYRRRIVEHEAGHFLLAYLFNVPVIDYTLSAWEAVRKGQTGRGGVQFDVSTIVKEADNGSLSVQSLDTYCSIWMAGIAAEQRVYGEAEGGGSDRDQIRFLWSRLNVPPTDCETKMRWSTLNAKTLIEKNEDAYARLVETMEERRPVADCINALALSMDAASDRKP